MTWHIDRDAEAEKKRFVALYGIELWDQIQAVSAPKPLASREVFRPKRPEAEDRPALHTEDSEDPVWWNK